MPRISLLSDALINKIAAGEVVERPASVVKELCENSLDAGATVIRVHIEEGGLGRIRVQDDGAGMDPEDARASLKRHATSKLRDLEGLFQIETLGFRGEALASIAAVSRLTLTTSERGARVGTRVEVEGGVEVQEAEVAPIPGTFIEVADLFFNVPARRKYMKRGETEARHIEDAVVRLSLAYPEVGFFLSHGDREVIASPSVGQDLRARMAAAMGSEVHPHLLELSERRLGLTVRGQVASPEFSRHTARGLFTFVNRRYVRDRNLNFAIQRAFSPLLAPGRQPVGAVFLEMDPHAVDVNVHPQKLEVRFADARGVTDAVHAAIQRALRGVPWRLQGGGAAQELPDGAAHYASAVDRFLERANSAAGPGGLPGSGFAPHPYLRVEESPQGLGYGQALPDRDAAPAPGYFASLRFLGALGKRFWLCEGSGATLVVLDGHAAFERLAFDVLLAELERRLAQPGEAPEPTLFTAQLAFSPAEAALLLERASSLRMLGLEVRDFGGQALALSSVPPALEGVDLHALLQELAPLLPSAVYTESASARSALAVMACFAATLEERDHSHQEVRRALLQLDATELHRSCRHAKVVVDETPFLDLVRRADRKN